MDFPTAIKTGFRQYASGHGRASRSEFWYWTLFSFLVTSAAAIIDAAIFGAPPKIGLLSPLLSLALLVPNVVVAVRRLHDVDRPWPWLLIAFTIIGLIVLLVWFCTKGTTGRNRFGADPLEADMGASPAGSVRAVT